MFPAGELNQLLFRARLHGISVGSRNSFPPGEARAQHRDLDVVFLGLETNWIIVIYYSASSSFEGIPTGNGAKSRLLYLLGAHDVYTSATVDQAVSLYAQSIASDSPSVSSWPRSYNS